MRILLFFLHVHVPESESSQQQPISLISGHTVNLFHGDGAAALRTILDGLINQTVHFLNIGGNDGSHLIFMGGFTRFEAVNKYLSDSMQFAQQFKYRLGLRWLVLGVDIEQAAYCRWI